ncbi:phospholipid:diacylglycerol acyltransferase [Paracoccidioides brasiliensis Pb18]|uniref:Phospholipid:diacylglycerol acyltransferase n=1 Tax=Paracoccidioides brasiliensis (strain Pb18) TaxID=502780 RepID=C1GM85_PARBD|nr:phospholipid:diacylglycerol acyltransferase [Paracoccidioides brasiliensis Pb18]EEH43551.2 hypothetical protein PADG_08171 [Paracoccidioides brasiliensis Pb18]
MSSLRRRVGDIFATTRASSAPGASAAATPDNANDDNSGSSSSSGSSSKNAVVVDDNGGKKLRFGPALELQEICVRRRSKRRNGLIFGLGGIFGIFLALFFANQNEVISLDALMDLNLDSLMDVMPAGMIRDASQFSQTEREAVSYDAFSVGLSLKTQGITANHSIIMVPGVISTGLESWGTDEKSRQYFRKRLWGSWTMMRALVLDKSSWKNHIMLDKFTGLDPSGIKLRAAQGFDATDFFITGYWIWNKILENLATIGYDPTNAFTAAYDWRLSYLNLERRDHYFSRLKAYIETAVGLSDRKVVLVSHSMGSQVAMFFFKWVESLEHGGGGPDWVETHIDSWINISGCMLGASKGVSAVLSGEMKDTAQLNAFAVYGLEKFLSKEERADLFRAMPGISSMLPKGGDAIWGNSTWAPDDQEGQPFTFGNFINFKETNSSKTQSNLTVDGALPFLFKHTDQWYRDQVEQNYSHGVAHTTAEVEANEKDPRKWLNPLEARLPIAPNLNIYCFYGVGKPTERSYFYHDDIDPLSKLNVSIDTTVTNGIVDRGVVMSEGDGTVNLLSLGYMCVKGWGIKRYNPAGAKVKVYEMPHEPGRFSPRGGPNTGDHVDILGRSLLNDLVLRIASGRGDMVEDHFVSRIKEYSDRVKISEEE